MAGIEKSGMAISGAAGEQFVHQSFCPSILNKQAESLIRTISNRSLHVGCI